MPFTKKKGIAKGAEVKGNTKQLRKRKEKVVIVDDDFVDPDDVWEPSSNSGKGQSKKKSSSKKTTIDYYDGRSSKSSSRRQSKGDVELMMECVEEELSPAQLKAIQIAKDEHEKANDLIKAARAGNILVPASQPNTFSIVPPTSKPTVASAPRQEPEQTIRQTHSEISKALGQPGKPVAVQRLPPPRPTQFMNKQKGPAAPNTTSSPDVILISESPPLTTKQVVQTPQVIRQPIVRTPPSVVTSPTLQKSQILTSNATPQQVYKFVSLPGSTPTNITTGQWVIKPLLTVPPQQQTTLSPPSGLPTPVQLVMPSPPSQTTKAQGDVSAALTPATYPQLHTSYLRPDMCPSDNIAVETDARQTYFSQGAHQCRRTCCSKLLPYKKEFHALIVSVIFRQENTLSIYGVSQDRLRILMNHVIIWNRKMRQKVCKYLRHYSGTRHKVIQAKHCDNFEKVLSEISSVTNAIRENTGAMQALDSKTECDVHDKSCDSVENSEDMLDKQQSIIGRLVESQDNCVEEATESRGLGDLDNMMDNCLTAGCLSAEIRELTNYVTDVFDEFKEAKKNSESQSESGAESDVCVDVLCSSVPRKFVNRCVHNSARGADKQLLSQKNMNWCFEIGRSEKQRNKRRKRANQGPLHKNRLTSLSNMFSSFFWRKYEQHETNKICKKDLTLDYQEDYSGFLNFSKETRAILSGFHTSGQFNPPENLTLWPLLTTDHSPISWHSAQHEINSNLFSKSDPPENNPSQLCHKYPKLHIEHEAESVGMSESEQLELDEKRENGSLQVTKCLELRELNDGEQNMVDAENLKCPEMEENMKSHTLKSTGTLQEAIADTSVNIEPSSRQNADKKNSRPWYQTLSYNDKSTVAGLAYTYGVSKLAKLLHIPKTELLTWRRLLRKKSPLLNKMGSIGAQPSVPIISETNRNMEMVKDNMALVNSDSVCLSSVETVCETRVETLKENANPARTNTPYTRLSQQLQERNPDMYLLITNLMNKSKQSLELGKETANSTSDTENRNSLDEFDPGTLKILERIPDCTYSNNLSDSESDNEYDCAVKRELKEQETSHCVGTGCVQSFSESSVSNENDLDKRSIQCSDSKDDTEKQKSDSERLSDINDNNSEHDSDGENDRLVIDIRSYLDHLSGSEIDKAEQNIDVTDTKAEQNIDVTDTTSERTELLMDTSEKSSNLKKQANLEHDHSCSIQANLEHDHPYPINIDGINFVQEKLTRRQKRNINRACMKYGINAVSFTLRVPMNYLYSIVKEFDISSESRDKCLQTSTLGDVHETASDNRVSSSSVCGSQHNKQESNTDCQAVDARCVIEMYPDLLSSPHIRMIGNVGSHTWNDFVSKEIQKTGDLIYDTDVFSTPQGKIFSSRCVERMCKLCCLVGIDAVHKHFEIPRLVLSSWMKHSQWYNPGLAVRKLSRELKTKLVYLRMNYGRDAVAKQFNLTRNTLDNWTEKYGDVELHNNEFTDADFRQLMQFCQRKIRSRSAKEAKRKNRVKETGLETVSETSQSVYELNDNEKRNVQEEMQVYPYPGRAAVSNNHESEKYSMGYRDSYPDFPLLKLTEIKEEPIDEELELLHGSSAQFSQIARPGRGYDYRMDEEIDRNRGYLGPRPFLVNEFGLGDGRSDSQPCNSTSVTGHTSNSESLPTTVSQSVVDMHDQSTLNFNNPVDNAKFTTQMNENSEVILMAPTQEKDKEQDRKTDQNSGMKNIPDQEDSPALQSVGIGKQSSRSEENMKTNKEVSSDTGLELKTPEINILTFHVSDKDLEQQRALRNTLLALKSRKGTNETSTVDTTSGEQKGGHGPTIGQNQQNTGRIETLIKGITNRVGQSYPPGTFVDVMKCVPVAEEDHSYVSPVKSPKLVHKLSPVRTPKSPSKAFTIPIIMRSKMRKVSEVDNSCSRTSSVDTLSNNAVSNEEPTSQLTSESDTSCDKNERKNTEKNVAAGSGVNLSEKLKSLLNADIFSIVDSDETNSKSSEAQEEDLIELLASAGRKTDHKGSGKNSGLKDAGPKPTPSRRISDSENGQNLQKRFFYSLGLKQKLGKLANRFSVVTVSKKYRVSPRTIAKWKVLYKDVDIPEMEFTEQEKEELRIVRDIKETHKKVYPDEYQIYIDNPEPEEEEHDERVELFEDKTLTPDVEPDVDEKNLKPYPQLREIVTERKKINEEKDEDDISKHNVAQIRQIKDPSKTILSKSVSSKPGLSGPKTSQGFVPSHPAGVNILQQSQVPLYIALDDTTANDVRQNLRQKLKSGDFQQTHVKSEGVFLGSGDSSETSASAFLNSDSQTFIPSPVDGYRVSLDDSTDQTSAAVAEKPNIALESKTKDQSGKGTVYLCPVEGVFKFRLTEEVPNEPSRETEKKQDTTSSSTGGGKDPEPSQAFKWSVVQEARKSGFEKTARWYNFPMTAIMKWHDHFLNEKNSRQQKLSVVHHAMKYGVIDAAEKFSVSRSKVVEWLSMEEVLDNKNGVSKQESDSSVETVVIPATENVIEKPAHQRTQQRGLSFDLINAKEGRILKPRFTSADRQQNMAGHMSSALTLGQQKSRMGPNSTVYASTVSKGSSAVYQEGLEGDIGTMPRFVKQPGASIEIASTWKQIQTYLNPAKQSEKKYSQEFKNKIIRECIERGQKVVSQQHKIPYNEISRWRLEAKKNSGGKSVDRFAPNSTIPNTGLETLNVKSFDSTVKSSGHQKKERTEIAKEKEAKKPRENESLKIKIKLAKLPEIIETSHTGISSTDKKSSEIRKPEKKTSKVIPPEKSLNAISKESKKEEGPSTVGDNETDFRMQVVNYCIQHGVLKTQKHFSVTRQSVIDLVKEYDELNKYSVQAFNKNLDFKTKLVSREKTSVEDGTQSEPIIVTNLQDYIVTAEYKQSVADYAVLHGITAATRKFKRKTSTVKSWISQFGKKDQIADSLTGKSSLSREEMEQQKLEVVEYAKRCGITVAAKKYGKKANTVKSWMGHQAKKERTKKKLENEQASEKEKNQVSQNPLKLTIPKESISQKQSIIPSPVWEQDFVIKPSSSNSPLKLTLSPRRKSPVIHITSDDVNDIETEDECDIGAASEFEEVATWDLDIAKDSRIPEKPVEADIREKIAATENKSTNSVATISNTSAEDRTENNIQGDTENASKDEIVIRPSDVPNVLMLEIEKGLIEQNETGHEQVHESEKFVINDEPEIASEDDFEENDEVEENTNEEVAEDVDRSDTCPDAGKLEQITDIEKDDVQVIGKEEDQLSEKEEEIEIIPYEKTIMFQLFNDNVDKFFNAETSIKYAVKQPFFEEKTKKQLESSKKTKKHRRYADVEIMENLDEACIFSPMRPNRRNQENNEEPKIDRYQEKTETDDQLKSNQGKEDNDVVESEDAERKDEKKLKIQNEMEEEVHKDEKDTDVKEEERGEIDTNMKLERSLFDFFVPSDEVVKPDRSKTELAESSKTDETNSLEKLDGTEDSKDVRLKINADAPRSLFANLMKNIKIPTKEKAEVSTSTSILSDCKQVSEENDDGRKDCDENKGLDMKTKERTERNLFDFLTPEPLLNSSTETTSISTSSSPRLPSLATNYADELPQNTERTQSVKMKPMFKFPKLQLPVNFSNIAKLGMAKIKEDEKSKTENLQDEGNLKGVDMTEKNKKRKELHVEGDQDSESNEKSKQTEDKVPDEPVSILQKLGTSVKDITATKTVTLEKDSTQFKGVVMETFEELRKRLAEERAKKREEFRANEVEMEETLAEKDEDKEAGVENGNEITDYEMYKDFAPQKIVLILDISKKHGIEFASTSFGLPPSVIVNWIIEKDRKHRKIGSAVSLEKKLLAVKILINDEKAIDEISKENSVNNQTVQSWKEEVKWLLHSKGVVSVLEKWQKVQSVTSLDETGKAPYTEIKKDLQCINDAEGEFSESKAEDKDTENEVKTVLDNIVESTVNALEKAEEIVAMEESDQTAGQEVPEVLSFVMETLPRDFTVEQKAMVVLLMDKYGLKEVHRKLGINKGTLWTWKNQNKVVKQYLREQNDGMRRKVVDSDSVKPGKVHLSPKEQPTMSKHTNDNKNGGAEKDEAVADNELEFLPSGYRYISPTKLPSSLKDTFKRPTKEYSTEQRIAIVKLVELYGVRTVHKQFRIPCGSIWNWQHSKNILAEIKKSDGKQEEEGEPSKAAKCLSFEEEQNSSDPFTIDLIMDRVLVAIETTDHLKFKAHQKADVVCMVNHFGMDYVCEKIPSIPRGTLWNWCHNKNLLVIVEKNMQLLKKYQELVGKKKSGLVAQEKVDKVMMTQRWLNSCQHTGTGAKRKQLDQDRDGVSASKKSKGSPRELAEPRYLGVDEISGCGRRSRRANDAPNSVRDSSSDSSVSSISGHTNGFEEILTDDETNAPSCYSKRSGTSGKNSQASKNSSSKKALQVKGNPVKLGKGDIVLNPAASQEITEKEGEQAEYEVLRIEPGAFSQLMVFYKVINSSKGGKADPPGSKRAASDTSPGPPAKKKSNKKNEFGEADSRVNCIPLDEYYYGTMEGNPVYEEEKGEYRFKCWYCSKMLYNNVRAMQHIQGHIDSTKQQNIDLSDLTQCKHCYKQFDTPFEMQTHVEKVHLSNKVLMCRICEKDFHSQGELINHMRQNHYASEMPYTCQLCEFRSSMYSDVVDHFKKRHDSSKNLLCLYCLRTFDVKFNSQGWGLTQTYYGHLMKHQSKSSAKKCIVCRLTFFNPQDVKLHRKNHHGSNTKGVQGLPKDKLSGSTPVMIKMPDSGAPQKKRSQALKSLNAPSISKIQDYGGVQLPKETRSSFCVECKMTMASTDHYKKHINCSLCRFATSCSVAYANHMMGFHSGQVSSLNLNIPWERPLADTLYCKCGFSTRYGNKIADHMVHCLKQTCYSQKPEMIADSNKAPQAKKGEGKKSDGSLLGMLGLVQKKPMTPRVRTAQGAAKAKKEDSAKEEKTPETKKTKSISPKPQLKLGLKTQQMLEIKQGKKSGKEETKELKEIEDPTENTKKMVKETEVLKDETTAVDSKNTEDNEMKVDETTAVDSKNTEDNEMKVDQAEAKPDVEKEEMKKEAKKDIEPASMEDDAAAESDRITDQPDKKGIGGEMEAKHEEVEEKHSEADKDEKEMDVEKDDSAMTVDEVKLVDKEPMEADHKENKEGENSTERDSQETKTDQQNDVEMDDKTNEKFDAKSSDTEYADKDSEETDNQNLTEIPCVESELEKSKEKEGVSEIQESKMDTEEDKVDSSKDDIYTKQHTIDDQDTATTEDTSDLGKQNSETS